MKQHRPLIVWFWAIGTLVTWFSTVTLGEIPPRLQLYSGTELKGTVLLCKSNQNTAGGFWRDLSRKRVEQGVMTGRQSTATTWRITLQGNRAEVIRVSGASQTIEEPEVYSLEQTTGGILLTYQKRSAGESSQVITIDPSNSSFVYSTHDMNPMWNRASIFYGSCQPYR